MKILLSGFCGHMGQEVVKLANAGYRGAELVGGVDINAGANEAFSCATSFDEALKEVDCIVDFSHHTCTNELLNFALTNKIPTVIATTGQTESEKAEIIAASKEIPIFFSANFSFGIALLVELAKKAAAAMPEAQIEIIEKHHDRKLDAPSGTALMLADAIHEVRPGSYNNVGRNGHGKRGADEIGIHSVRMGNLVGDHEVILGTQNQTITLRHEAHSRALFAEGALVAAEFLCRQKAGLYTMKDMV